jgi:uncharacterized repeat protein (TIGR02543 family)
MKFYVFYQKQTFMKGTPRFNFTIIFAVAAAILLSFSSLVYGTTYYVATNGNNSNTGTSVGSPFLTIAYAVGKVVAGDTIYVRGGTYTTSTTISLSKSGTSTSKYCLFVYPGDERPILDFSGMTVSGSNRGINLSGSYWYIKGLRIKGAGDNGIYTSGAYNTLEFCDFYENRDGGCQLGGGAHDNRIINCDSYYNADYGPGTTTNGGNADGFSPKLDVGTGNYFYGCRSWLNSDDGWDGYLRPSDGITTTLENCWTWKNGYLKDGVTTTADMNGNGFKLGGSDTKTLRHNFIVKNCLAFYNKGNGFDQNSNVGSITIYNGTSFNNVKKNFYLNSSVTMPAGSVFTVTNCAAMGATGTSFRTGTILNTNQFGATSADFISVDTTGVSAPRKADGSLPDISFMHLATGSSLIDAGTDVGLPYNGTKPDLGCFETGNSAVQYVLNTGVANGSGSVSPSGATNLYSSNSISISATPAANYMFDKWTDGTGVVLSTSNPYTVSMNGGNLTVNANFVSLPQYTLTTSIASGSGSISPANGSQFYAGTSVPLTATPATNYVFVSWGGDASGTSPTTSITMDADKSITASFALVKRTLTLAVNPLNSGTVSPSSGTTYDHGSSVKLTATPATGYVFDTWTDNTGTLSTYDTLTITMDADKSITGNFKLNTGTDQINGSMDNTGFTILYGPTGEIEIAMNLEEASVVSVHFYNTQGALVTGYSPQKYPSGYSTISLDDLTLTPGIYLCKMTVNGKGITHKLVVY